MEDHCLKPAWANNERPCLKNAQHKTGVTVTQIVEHLLTRQETLRSNLSTPKKKKDKISFA
jgi:hypothetical protein